MGLTLKTSLLLLALAPAALGSAAPPVHQRHDLFYAPVAENIEAFVAEHPFIVFLFFHGTIEDQVYFYDTIKSLSDQLLLNPGPNPVLFAEVDLDTDADAALKVGVRSAPLLRLFHHGIQVPFRGTFSMEAAKRWIRKYANQVALYIDQDDNKYHHEDEVNCVLLRPNVTDSEIEMLGQMAKEHHDVIFYYTDVDKFMDKEAGPDHFRVVVRRRADHHAQSLRGEGPLKKEVLEKFLARAKLPDSVPFAAFESNRFFHRKVTTCFFFYDDPNDPKLQIFRKVGHKFKTRLEFSHVNMTSPIGSRLTHLMGVNPARPGVVKIVRFEGEEEFKYRLKAWETQADLERFVEQYLAGAVQPYMKSEPVPVPNPGPVHKLVGKNVQGLVFDNPHDVIVFATFVLELSPSDHLMVQKVVDRLEHAHHINLTIATFDATRNEHHALKLKDYPVWAVYPHGRKHTPCLAGNMWDVEAIVRFVENCLNRKIRYHGQDTPLDLDDSL